MKHKWTVLSAAFAMAIMASSARADDEQHGDYADDDVEETTRAEEAATTRVTFIYFDRQQTTLDTDDEQRLDAVKQWAAQDPERRIIIAAHPDMVGTAEHTETMCDARGNIIGTYLYESGNGVEMTRIQVIGYGAEIPQEAADEEKTHFVVYVVPVAAGDQPVQEEAAEPLEEQRAEPEYPEPVPEDTPTRTTPTEQPVYTQPQMREEDDDDGTDHLITPMGMGISLGGGVTGFVDGDMRDFTDVGGAWEARLTLGTRSTVAVEAAYIGTAQDIEALGLDDDALLIGNGAEGNVRLNVLTTPRIQPYVYGGLGWTHYSLAREDFNTSSIQDDEDILHVPVGAGLGFRAMGAMIDIRGTYRVAFNDDIIRGTDVEFGDDPDVRLDSWTASAKVGWEF